MRKVVDSIWRAVATNKWTWRAMEMTFLKLTRHLQVHRDKFERERNATENQHREEEFVAMISPDLTVRNGPFKGMIYPSVTAIGSAVIPKFLGSYEREISEQLELLLSSQRYDRVIDVGAAEGYYAVGVARKLMHTLVHAYDIDPVAQQMCRSLAETNNVSDRVFIGGRCDPAELCELLSCERALIIVDCEGGESELLTPEVVEKCGRHDLLVELHDDVVLGFSERIAAMFSPTHEVKSFPAVYDAIKARAYQYREIEKLTYEERRWTLSENRSTGIEWFFILSKTRYSHD